MLIEGFISLLKRPSTAMGISLTSTTSYTKFKTTSSTKVLFRILLVLDSLGKYVVPKGYQGKCYLQHATRGRTGTRGNWVIAQFKL